MTRRNPRKPVCAVSELVTFIGRELSLPVQQVDDHITFLERGFRNLSRFVDFALEAETNAQARQRLEQLRAGIPSALQATREGCTRLAELVAGAQALAQAASRRQ